VIGVTKRGGCDCGRARPAAAPAAFVREKRVELIRSIVPPAKRPVAQVSPAATVDVRQRAPLIDAPPALLTQPPVRTDIALILGGAECVWEDVAELERILGRPWDGIVIAANDIGSHWPRRLDHWATLHPEQLGRWIEDRRKKGLPGGFVSWAHVYQAGHSIRGRELIDRTLPRQSCSGIFAGYVARAIGCRGVFCGVPLTRTPHFAESRMHPRGRPWTSWATHYREFEKIADEMRGWMRSMSGLTADRLGRPDLQWLEG